MINIDHLPKVGGAENIWYHIFILIDVVNFLWCVYLGFFFHLKHSDEITVLQSTVTGAISWIQAGLPLKKLKIVLYEDNNKELNSKFAKLKQTHLKSQRKVSLFSTSRKFTTKNMNTVNMK